MVALVAIALPTAALAADPTTDQYGSQLQTLSVGSSDNGTPGGGTTPSTASATPPAASAPSATDASGGGSLPFTGLDVGLLAAIAGGLAIAGFMLRRQAREASDRS